MNWFERYGISGLYFVTLIIAWFYAFTYEKNSGLWTIERIQIIGAVGAGISVPTGFIISAFAQFVYYVPYNLFIFWLFFNPIYTKFIRNFPARLDLHKKPEWAIEADVCISSRLTDTEDSCELERLRWISDTMTKRWDVLAISHIFIVATILAPFLSGLLVWFAPNVNYISNWTLWKLLLSANIITVAFLRLNNWILGKQLIEMYHLVNKALPKLLEK